MTASRELCPWAGRGTLTSGIPGWWIPEQAEACQLPRDQIPRQVEAGWPPGIPRLDLGILKVSSTTSAGKDSVSSVAQEGLKGCNLNSLLVCPLRMGIGTMI